MGRGFAQFTQFLRAFVSSAALTELYARRQALRPAEENRSKPAVATAGILFLLTIGFLLTMAWTRHDAESWLKGRAGIVRLAPGDVAWSLTPVASKACASGEGCYTELTRGAVPVPVDFASYRLALPPEVPGDGLAVALARAQVAPQVFAALAGLNNRTHVLSLPGFVYRRADLWVDGRYRGTSYDGESLAYTFDARDPTAQPGVVEIVLELHGEQVDLSRVALPKVTPLDRTTALMPASEWRAWREFIATDRAGRGDFIGAIARVAMAVFVLILFLIIDGSPETLGLGLFLGFEALAITVGFNWLPFGNADFLKHYAYQMGDIFRVYFFLQLARMIDKRVGPWLLFGTLASIPYGLARHYELDLGWTWLYQIPRVRDLAAGLLGVVVCARAAIFLRGRRLPWRVTALIVAAIGSFEQMVDPVALYVPVLRESDAVQTLIDLLQPLGAWLLAFSAFINISTLENRVKLLSSLEARAKEMEKEMELGRAVQQAFMSLPRMPEELRMVCHHEAMLYVSGDTYFVDWNEHHGKLTFLINDVTGHGIQAALKASGVNVIANTVWAASPDGTWRSDKLPEYARLAADFYRRMDATPDILAMGGGEFDVRSGRLVLYRVNFPFPLLIEPKRDHLHGEDSRRSDNWRIQLLTLPNAKVSSRQLTDGTFVVLTSDGFLDTSRRTAAFLRHMRRHVGHASAELTADDIKRLILECPVVADRRDDDKTMTIFQWRPGREAIPARSPRAG